MTDVSTVVPEGDTPVNPYSLLEAVNRSSDTAHTGWLIFLGIMTYFMIAVAGVTHKDLLLETPVELPIMQVKIQLAQFFQFAPIVLVLLHMGLISQLTLLARETLEFDNAIRLLEPNDNRSHPLRLEMNNFFFVQAIAGPQRSAVMSAFLHGISWLTLVILPVVLILYIQVTFLPYHDVAITWTHRAALLIDVLLLVTIGVFLLRIETSFFQAFKRTSSAHPISFGMTGLVLSIVAFFSLFVATVPGEALDRFIQSIFRDEPASEDAPRGPYVTGFMLPFLSGEADEALFGIFRRNLLVTDTDLVSDKDLTAGEPSLTLRGRDLRFAKLDRSDLHQADLTGANMRGASFIGADLRGAWLQCADTTELLLTENRETAKCATARRANFTRAQLTDAHMAGLDLTNATLDEARLENAELPYAILAGASFSSARLEKADMTGGIQAQGATFLITNLQGADMTGAQLHAADLSSALMQGAVLNYAHLEGATLRDAELDAASLQQARLYNVDLTGARLVGADLRGSSVWATPVPSAEAIDLADFSGLKLLALDAAAAAALKETIEKVPSRRLRQRLNDKMAVVVDPERNKDWSSGDDSLRWQGLAVPPQDAPGDTYSARLTGYLAKVMCQARWANGALATGVARRAQTRGFQGDMVALYDRLKAADCPASKSVPSKIMKAFGFAADVARGQ